MNFYAEAIEICSSNRTDWKEIVIKIAKQHPKSVVDAVEEDWKKEARALALGKNKSAAIKFWRKYSGDSHIDSKKAVEAMQK